MCSSSHPDVYHISRVGLQTFSQSKLTLHLRCCPQVRSSGLAAAKSEVAVAEQRAAQAEDNAVQLARANSELEAMLREASGAEDPKVSEQQSPTSSCPRCCLSARTRACLIWLCSHGLETDSLEQDNTGIAEASCTVHQATAGQLISAVERQQQLEGQLADAQLQLAEAQQKQKKAGEYASQAGVELEVISYEQSMENDSLTSELTAARQQVCRHTFAVQ
jgi:hypothetical protein